MVERGYARVSTDEQSVEMQVQALVAAGVPADAIVTEWGSGRSHRPGLDALLDELGEGDRLTVWRFDRLFRSTRHMLELVDRLESQGVALRSLRDQIDTSTSTGRFFFTVTAAIAQLEADLIRERTKAGLAAAAAAGVRLGRPTVVTEDQARLVMQLLAQGMSHRRVAASMGLSRALVGRVARGEVASLAHVTIGTGTDLLDQTPATERPHL